jgi:hypothetical protein
VSLAPWEHPVERKTIESREFACVYACTGGTHAKEKKISGILSSFWDYV